MTAKYVFLEEMMYSSVFLLLSQTKCIFETSLFKIFKVLHALTRLVFTIICSLKTLSKSGYVFNNFNKLFSNCIGSVQQTPAWGSSLFLCTSQMISVDNNHRTSPNFKFTPPHIMHMMYCTTYICIYIYIYHICMYLSYYIYVSVYLLGSIYINNSPNIYNFEV